MSLEQCGCDEVPIIPFLSDPRESIVVRGIGNLQFTETYELGKKIFTGAIVEYAPPVISIEANPLREVGATISFTFHGNIQAGSKPIINRTITPAGPDLSGSFEVVLTSVTKSTAGLLLSSLIEVEDEINTIVSRQLAINFRNKVFRGFSWKDGVSAGQTFTAADIVAMTGTIAESIHSVYHGEQNYVIPAVAYQQSIVWAFEAGTTPITQIEFNNLPFPVVLLPGTINIVNPNNASLSANYSIVVSANKFGTGTLSLDML